MTWTSRVEEMLAEKKCPVWAANLLERCASYADRVTRERDAERENKALNGTGRIYVEQIVTGNHQILPDSATVVFVTDEGLKLRCSVERGQLKVMGYNENGYSDLFLHPNASNVTYISGERKA